MKNVREKLKNARKLCPNMHEEMYLLTDYMSTVANDELVPVGMVLSLSLALSDLKRGENGFSKKELPDYLVKNKTQILAQAMLFPQIIDAIADEEFAKEFRELFKRAYNVETPKKITPIESDDNNFPIYVKVASDWWANAICNPKFDNGVDGETGIMMAMLAMGLAEEKEELSQESIVVFKKHLGEAIVREMENIAHFNLRVDYSPCRVLAEAGCAAGISENRFPWKTMMHVSKQEVGVSEGYGAPYQILWKATE